jgi:DNA polymerase-1
MAEVIFVDSKQKALDCYEAVQREPGLLYWDTETTGLLVRSGTQDVGRTLQISCRPWDVAWVFDIRTTEWLEAITAIFKLAENICAHNTKFDIHVTETYGIDLLGLFNIEQIWDTTWLAHFHDERTSRRLKDLAARYLRIDAGADQRALKKVMKDNGWGWDTVPLRYLVEYGGQDAIMGGELYDLLLPKVQAHSMEAIMREQRLLPVVYRMERNGIKLDMDMVQRLHDEAEEQMAAALATLGDIWDREVVPKADKSKPDALNLASTVQLKAAFRAMDAPLPNCQAVTFHKLAFTAEDGTDVQRAAEAILVYKVLAKKLSTYLRPWLVDATEAGRIHPSFNTLGTITGRFSSSDPNFQNITNGDGLRDCLVADSADNVLVVADYEQMELRQFAHYASDERMRAAFLSGDDIYQQVADLLGVSRSIGKMITLASQYGAGWKTTKAQAIVFAFKLGQGAQVPELERLDWKALMAKFHANYRVQWLADATERQARTRGQVGGEQYILTTGGRRMRPKLIKLPETDQRAGLLMPIFKDLGNSLIQGSCADVMKESMIAIAEAGYLEQMRLTVHDEVVLDVPLLVAPDVLREVSALMERDEYVPPLTVSGDWAERYGEAK